MLAYLGQTLQVTRRVNNVCVQQPDGMYFGKLDGCVLLSGNRCDGQAQGGCQMACPMMWKTSWLESHESNADRDTGDSFEAAERAALHELEELIQKNISTVDPDGQRLVSCQATELFNIAPRRSQTDVSQYINEINLNRVSVISLASSLCSGLLARVKGQSNGIAGTRKTTPVADLNLQPGDRVRVKTKDQIISTLDVNGKNRGLWFDPVMLRYCGQTLNVSARISRIVDERTGKLITMKTPSIVLEDLHCQPEDRRFCSRLLHLFWREIWLEQV